MQELQWEQLTEEQKRLTRERTKLQTAVETLELKLSVKDEHINNLTDQLEAKDATLEAIYGSHGWKGLLTYYRITNKIFPLNSKRRMLAKVILNVISNPKNFFKNINRTTVEKFIYYFRTKEPQFLEEKVTNKLSDVTDLSYNKWIAMVEQSTIDINLLQKEIESFQYKPKISIITPVYNTDKQWLVEMLESVLNQIYPNYELCLVDGGSSLSHVREILEEYSEKDGRFRLKFMEENKGIAGNSNEALTLRP